MIKFADVSDTSLMPLAPPSDTTPMTSKAVIKKTGSVGHLLSGHKGDVMPDTSEGTSGEQASSNPQAKVMKPHVDVSAQEPPKTLVEKKASRYALGDRYPLDGYDQVKMASAYFDEWYKRFDYADRHEYAVNLVKRASEIGVEVSSTAQKYGSETYAPEEEIKVAFDIRREALGEKTNAVLLLDKVAEQRAVMGPDLFCQVIAEFDKVAGLVDHYDSYVPDPYLTTYGLQKQASFSETLGNQTVTEDDLSFLARNRINLVHGTFGGDVSKEFKMDPVGVYKSMPTPQRKILANLAKSQNSADPVIG